MGGPKIKGSKCKKPAEEEHPAALEEDGSLSNGSGDEESSGKDEKGLIQDSDADTGKCQVLVLLSDFSCNLTHIFVKLQKGKEEEGKRIG